MDPYQQAAWSRGHAIGIKHRAEGHYNGGHDNGLATTEERHAFIDGYEAGWDHADQNLLPMTVPDDMRTLCNELKATLACAGLTGGEGIRLVKRLAKENKVKDWPDTKCPCDYRALIRLVRRHIDTLCGK